jgi:hypothetical protein
LMEVMQELDRMKPLAGGRLKSVQTVSRYANVLNTSSDLF